MRFLTQQGRVLLLAVLAVVMICLLGCGGGGKLVGQWVNVATGSNVELFKDRTGSVDNTSITWKIEGKRFVMTEEKTTFAGDYVVKGYEFTLTRSDGRVVVWVKKDKLEEYKKKNAVYFTDSRNNQKYRAVKIGGKTWMAENLNHQTESGSWCYENNSSNCNKYGRLYDWNTARSVCPSGWHLPSRQEWNDLVGDENVAGKALKSVTGWASNSNGIDGYGFSALPGGIRGPRGFLGDGMFGTWWTATEYDDDNAYVRGMGDDEDKVAEDNVIKEGAGLSVRCVEGLSTNQPPPAPTQSPAPSNQQSSGGGSPNTLTDSRDGKTYKTVKMPNGETWMAQNLNYQIGNSWCYDNNNSNCDKYGRLYDWETAKTVCPIGWKLPSREEWNGLVKASGGLTAGKALKSTAGWGSDGNGTDDYGFSALPGGQRYSDGMFSGVGYSSIWWTASESGSGSAYYQNIGSFGNDVRGTSDDKSYSNSVRCLQKN
jgi:uncharacterized protein (TIGR02145 family)